MLEALASSPPDTDLAVLAGWAQPLIGTTTWTFLTFLLLLVFPNGRAIGPRWGGLVWPALAAVLVMAIGLAFGPGRLVLRQPFENPFGMQGVAGGLASVCRWLGLAVVFGLAIVAAWSFAAIAPAMTPSDSS
jgi:hypothetical protein